MVRALAVTMALLAGCGAPRTAGKVGYERSEEDRLVHLELAPEEGTFKRVLTLYLTEGVTGASLAQDPGRADVWQLGWAAAETQGALHITRTELEELDLFVPKGAPHFDQARVDPENRPELGAHFGRFKRRPLVLDLYPDGSFTLHP